jgi:hypothetical protein
MPGNGMRVVTTALGVPITTSGWKPSLSFSSGILIGIFAIPIRVCSRGPAETGSSKRRPWLQRKTVGDFIDGCSCYLSIRKPRGQVFQEGRILEFFFDPNGAGNAKNDPARYSVQISRRGSGRHGLFCRRSVALVFAGFRSWRFVRARSATRVEARERRGFLLAKRPARSARQ